MPSPTEAARIAAAVNLLRPEWPTASVQTLIASKHRARPYQDLAVALTYVACDPASSTPARINNSGPWWRITPGGEETTGPWDRHPCQRCRRPEHPGEGCGQRDAETAERGAAAARALLRAALTNPANDEETP